MIDLSGLNEFRRAVRAATLLPVAALLGLLFLAPAGALADDEGFFVDETKLPFDPEPGFEDSTRLWGILDGAGYRIEVPANWNHELVMYAHGVRAEGELELTVDDPPLRLYLLANGFAWAASSFSRNHYDVKAGVLDTNKLAKLFFQTFGPTERTYIHGHSMGGHITGAAIEMFPNVICPSGGFAGVLCRVIAEFVGRIQGGVHYDGAVPMCGPMGDVELFNYFAAHGLLAKAIAGIESPVPDPAFPTRIGTIFATFSLDPLNGLNYPVFRSVAGQTFFHALQQVSGGVRPTFQAGYESGFLFWESIGFLYQYGGLDGSIPGVEPLPVVDNTGVFYQLDSDPAHSADEIALNEAVNRVMADPDANKFNGIFLRNIPVITGRITMPVVTLHTLGDLFVPFSMEKIYAERVADYHRSNLLVQRAIRDAGHCVFTPEEQVDAFADMVNWVENGVKPAGDDVLDPVAVADPDFGCAFTSVDRPNAPACP